MNESYEILKKSIEEALAETMAEYKGNTVNEEDIEMQFAEIIAEMKEIDKQTY